MAAVSGWVIASYAFTAVTTIYTTQKRKEAVKKQQKEAAAQTIEVRPTGSGNPIPAVYGRMVVEGINVYTSAGMHPQMLPSKAEDITFGSLGSRIHGPGDTNQFLMVQTAICVGGIEGIDSVLINEKNAETDDISEDVVMECKLGDTPGVPTGLSLGFGTDERDETARFTGIAHSTVVCDINWKDPKFSGIPDHMFFVRGRKIKPIASSIGEGT